jgi:uncharacterized RDD family membrane protein YckC
MSTAPQSNNPFAPPTAHVEDVNDTAGHEPAGRGARLGAVLIDGLLQGAVFFGLTSTVLPLPTPKPGSNLFMLFAIQLALSAVIFAALQGYLLATQGQTIGKKLLGLRIVRSNGERASTLRLLGLRTFFSWALTLVPVVGIVYALADCLAIFRGSRKCLHDNIADTIVVRV